MGADVVADIPDIPEAVWHSELPFSPTLAGVTPGLALELGIGQRHGERRPIAALRYRMPDPVVRRYRGRVAPAIFVVAVDLGSGDVFEGACLGHDRPPAAYDPTASPTPSVDGPSMGGFVNVDVLAHLGLPPHAGRYLLLAWLDEWVSAARLLDVPADPRRVTSALRPSVSAADAVSVLPAAAAGTAVPGVSLSRSGPGKLLARWSLVEPSAVVILGYALEERRVVWELLALGRIAHAKAGGVEVSANAFLGTAAPISKAFLLVAGGQGVAVVEGP
jgi:hypothetical protein